MTTSPGLHCERCAHDLAPDALFCPMCGAPRLRPDGDALIGTIIADRYLLHKRLGHGASGNIYQGEHVTLRRRVAIKILHHELSRDDLSIERFRREATTVGQIDNEHIVEVLDFGRMSDGRLFLAMEYLEGETLAEALKREGRLPIAKVVDVLIQLGEALMEAHAMGYIHRDLRPRNVFLARRRGQEGYIKLLDFGLAKLVEREGEAASTSLGMTFGDPHYMSPEQAHGEAVDRRGDIYSMGAIAFQMLIGQPPFTGEKVFDVLTAHLENAPPVPSALRPDVPRWLDAIVLRMLAKAPDDRFVTVYRMVEALRAGQASGTIMPDEIARKTLTVAPPAPAPRSRETDIVRVLPAAETGSGPASAATTMPGIAPPPGSAPPPSAAPPSAPAPLSGSSASGMSGMWFADGEAMEEEQRRAGANAPTAKAPPRKNGGTHRPSWSQEAVYADDDGRRKKLIVAAVAVFGVALVAILVLALWPKAHKKAVDPLALAATAADAGEPDAPPAPPGADAAPTAVASNVPDAGVGPDAKTAVAVVPPGKDGHDPGKDGHDPGKDGHDPGKDGHDPGKDVHDAQINRTSPPDAGGDDVSPTADAAQADFYVKLGRQALSRGDAVGAATNFNKAREFDPKSPEAIAGLGEVAMQQGYYEDAVVHLEAASRLAPRSARIWTLLGQAYQGAGKPKPAAAAFKRALKLEPGNDAARKGYQEVTTP